MNVSLPSPDKAPIMSSEEDQTGNERNAFLKESGSDLSLPFPEEDQRRTEISDPTLVFLS